MIIGNVSSVLDLKIYGACNVVLLLHCRNGVSNMIMYN